MTMPAERGRPRSFDTETALQRATEVFWRHGFQAASMAELTAATGLSKPSLYAAFGDKASLYLQCLQRYGAQQVELQNQLLAAEPDARRAVDAALRGAWGGTEQRLLKRLQAEREGQLPPSLNAKSLATLLASVLSGMAVMAKGGQSRKKLDAVVDAAMAVWPATKPKTRRQNPDHAR